MPRRSATTFTRSPNSWNERKSGKRKAERGQLVNPPGWAPFPLSAFDVRRRLDLQTRGATDCLLIWLLCDPQLGFFVLRICLPGTECPLLCEDIRQFVGMLVGHSCGGRRSPAVASVV